MASRWDKFLLVGEPSPGLCISVAGASNPRGWDEKKATNSSGASLVYTGDGLAKFKVRLLLWTDAHKAEWKQWKRLLVPPTDKNPNALDAEHPRLEELPVPVTAVVVEDAGSPEPQGDGREIVEISFKQFRKPAPATAKPSGSKSGNGSGPGGTNTDPVDDYITELTNEVLAESGAGPT